MIRNSWLLLTLTLLGLAVGSVGWLLKKCPGGVAVNRAAPVRVERVDRETIPYALQARGELRPVKEANVVAPLPGVVKELRYKVGDSVSEGTVVAIIEPHELIQRVAKAEANLAAARTHLAEKERQFGYAEKQLQKTQDLVKQDLIARRDLDQARLATDTARAQVELALAQVAQQEAMLAESRKELDLTRVTATFSGVVTATRVEPGVEIGASSPLLTIAGLDILKVTITVPENDLSFAREGMAVEVRLDKSPARVHRGRVARMGSKTESSGGILAEIHLLNRNSELKPGATVSVLLAADGGKDVLFVPASAVMETQGKYHVYTVANGLAQRKDVVVSGERGREAAIKSGLNEGEWVVVSGHQNLQGGEKVRLIDRHDADRSAGMWDSVVCVPAPGEELETPVTSGTD
ncbi:MAG: efflux RND transporter periplasmic adaptor subunit [Candidatus Binatia bacterium]